jgi:hypothetical protein
LVARIGYKPGAAKAVGILRRLHRLLAKIADSGRGFVMRVSKKKRYEYDINSRINADTWNDGKVYSCRQGDSAKIESRHITEKRAKRAAAGRRMAVRDFHRR